MAPVNTNLLNPRPLFYAPSTPYSSVIPAHINRAITTSGVVQKFWIKPPVGSRLGTQDRLRRYLALKPMFQERSQGILLRFRSCDLDLLQLLWVPSVVFWLPVALGTAEWNFAPSFCAILSPSGAISHNVLLPFIGFSWSIFSEVSSHVLLPSLEAPLKPAHHGWPCLYLKFQWHSFQHHSDMQPPQYDNRQMCSMVLWLGNEPRLQWEEHWILTSRPPGLAEWLLVGAWWMSVKWKIKEKDGRQQQQWKGKTG